MGKKSCSACGANKGVEMHHLYPKILGCPDELTVPLCFRCHAETHQLRHRVDIGKLISQRLWEKRQTEEGRGQFEESRKKLKTIQDARYEVYLAQIRPILEELAASETTVERIAEQLRARQIPMFNQKKITWRTPTVSNTLARLGIRQKGSPTRGRGKNKNDTSDVVEGFLQKMAPIVNEIAEGKSRMKLEEMKNSLNERGIKTRAGNQWHAASVWYLIKRLKQRDLVPQNGAFRKLF